jgi:hypothetical protein
MAFEQRPVYRPLSGQDLKDIIPARVREAMGLDSTINIARSFPLVRYEVKITITPFEARGTMDPKELPAAGEYVVDQMIYSPVMDQAVELVEKSPIYGREADPQELRQLAGQGTVQSARTNTGEVVDVRTKPGSRELAQDLPPVRIVEPQSPPAEPPAAKANANPHARYDMAEPPSAEESAEETAKIEEQRWAAKKPDRAAAEAQSAIINNFGQTGEVQHPGGPAAGRVSVIRSVADGGGQDHGRRR